MNLIDEIKIHYKRGDILMKLIYINVAVFLFIRIIDLIMMLLGIDYNVNNILSLFSVPADFKTLLFHFWTIFTYMFTHFDVMHILFNMLVLFWFSKIFLQYLEEKQLLSVYILGGLSGAALYILSFNIFPGLQEFLPGSMALGASASVMAILIAISVYVPDFTIHLMFLGPIRLKYVALMMIGIDIVSITSGNAGGHIAHLGGALFGYLYIMQLRKGRDLGKGISTIFEKITGLFRSKPKMKVTVNKQYSPNPDWDYNKRKTDLVKDVDRILEKVKKSGYESLSKEEKQILFGAKDL